MKVEDSWAEGVASCCAEVQYSFTVAAGCSDADSLLQHCSEPSSALAPLWAAWWLCLYRLVEARRICTSCRISQSILYSHLVLCIVIALICKSAVSKSVIRRFFYKAIKILDLIMDPRSAVLALKRKKKRRNDIQLNEEKFWGTKLHIKVCVLYAPSSSWSSFRKQSGHSNSWEHSTKFLWRLL